MRLGGRGSLPSLPLSGSSHTSDRGPCSFFVLMVVFFIVSFTVGVETLGLDGQQGCVAGDGAPTVTKACFSASAGTFGIVSVPKRKEVVEGTPDRGWRVESCRGDLRAVRLLFSSCSLGLNMEYVGWQDARLYFGLSVFEGGVVNPIEVEAWSFCNTMFEFQESLAEQSCGD